MREEQLGKDQAGHCAVQKEIIPFDRGADRRCDDGTAQLDLMLGRAKRVGVNIHRGHERALL